MACTTLAFTINLLTRYSNQKSVQHESSLENGLLLYAIDIHGDPRTSKNAVAHGKDRAPNNLSMDEIEYVPPTTVKIVQA